MLKKSKGQGIYRDQNIVKCKTGVRLCCFVPIGIILNTKLTAPGNFSAKGFACDWEKSTL